MTDFNDADALASLSETELDRMIGECQLAGAAGSKFATDSEKAEIGREYFQELLPEIRAKVCKSEILASLLAAEHKERNEIVIGIVGGLLYGTAVPPLLLAAKALSYGFGRLCPAGPK